MFINEFPIWLQDEIDERGLSITNVASTTGVNYDRLCKILCRKATVKASDIEKLETLFPGVSEKFLLAAQTLECKQSVYDDPKGKAPHEEALKHRGRAVTNATKISAIAWWGRQKGLTYGATTSQWDRLTKKEQKAAFEAYFDFLDEQDAQRAAQVKEAMQNKGPEWDAWRGWGSDGVEAGLAATS